MAKVRSERPLSDQAIYCQGGSPAQITRRHFTEQQKHSESRPSGNGDFDPEPLSPSFWLGKSGRPSNKFEAGIAALAMGGHFFDKFRRERSQVSLGIPRRDCPCAKRYLAMHHHCYRNTRTRN